MSQSEPPPDDGLPHENPNRPREYHGARTIIAAVGVVAAVAAALWLTLLRPAPEADGGVVELPPQLIVEGREVGSRSGNLAPDFELQTLGGETFRLSDHRGQPILLNFWASWCGPCRREVPALIRAQTEHGERGLLIVGINIEEANGPAQEFASEFGINYAMPMDYGGAVFRAYGGGGPNGPPRSFFVDPDGVITRIYAGQAPDELIEQHTREFAEQFGRAP